MLTSLRNPIVSSAARLKKRAFREEERSFLVEGAQGVFEAIAESRLETLFTTDELHPAAVRAREIGVECHLVSDEVIGKITSTVTPQPVVGVASFVDVGLSDVPQDGCVALLHEVRDPGNAGTVLRSADAAGAAGVVFSETSVDVYNAKTIRASAGSVFHLPIVRAVETARAIDHLRERGFRALAMDAHGAESLYEVDLSGPIAFVFGNEAHGLPEDVARRSDASVRVPCAGKAESLNLAAAATVCLFEWARRPTSGAVAMETIIAAAAHDIRSPLTAMKGFGFALEKRWDSMTEEQRAMMLGGIVHDADRMDTILRQLVDAARVLAGNLEPFPEQVDVAGLVRDLAAEKARDPEHPPIEWAGEADVVFVDPVRLKTTLHAFLESLVWWAHDGPIRVSSSVRDGWLHLAVSRDGTELDSAGAEALFTPRRPGSGGGSKVGMFVARGVVEAQGGRTWAEVVDGTLGLQLELPARPVSTE